MNKIINDILQSTKYNGVPKHTKSLSGSSFSLEPMQLYLRWIHGDIGEDKDFGGNTLGTVAHLGFEQIFKNKDGYRTELSLEKELPNGWKVTGTIDLVDDKNKIIYDYKLLAKTSYQKIVDKFDLGDYMYQQNIYRYLLGDDYDMQLFCINKGGSAALNNQYSFVDVPIIEDVEQMLIDKTDELQYMIDNPDEVPECNIWKFGKDKEKQPNKCKYYCGWRDQCLYWNKRNNTNNHFAMRNLLM